MVIDGVETYSLGTTPVDEFLLAGEIVDNFLRLVERLLRPIGWRSFRPCVGFSSSDLPIEPRSDRCRVIAKLLYKMIVPVGVKVVRDRAIGEEYRHFISAAIFVVRGM